MATQFNNPQIVPPAPSLSLGDIYYVLFRHKWKIILCTTLGVLAAAAVRIYMPLPYQSEAKLFIRYVIDNKDISSPGAKEATKSPDQRGETIINSEAEILTSLDLAKQVATSYGPEKILAKSGGGKNPNDAAAVILKGLKVEVPAKSSVIRVTFQSPDAAIVQPVLTALVEAYLKKHVEVHESVGIVGDFLTQETDQLRARLVQTEDELRKARNKAGVISLEDSKKDYSVQIARIRQEILTSQAELAERAATLEAIAKQAPAAAPQIATPEVPPAKVDEYRVAVSRLEALRKMEQELLTQFTEGNSRVQTAHAQVTDAEKAKTRLEEDFPGLLRAGVANPAQSAVAAGAFNLANEAARISALQSKIKVLNAQLDQIRTEAAGVDQMEVSILDPKRKKELEEANYKYYAATLEQNRIDEALGDGRVSNISQIQTPTPPFVDGAKSIRLLLMVAAGGIALGLSWAFLNDLYFDHSVRRPVDVERMAGLHMFISIPDAGKNGHLRLGGNGGGKRRLMLPAGKDSTGKAASGGAELVPVGGPMYALVPFFETLRDRLMSYFESINLTHKPKLVAVTGLANESGVTSIAAGLSKTFSETGDGNVLLVDMTAGQGSAQQFYKGKAVCGIDEILSTRDNAQFNGNLYVVGEEPNSDKLSRALPKRFNQLVPKLKASDFDYIIFDMPPVSQISITPRLAGFMDMVLLVIESEKTHRDVVQRAAAMLAQSKAHVGAVLNKTRNYVPASLQGDLKDV